MRKWYKKQRVITQLLILAAISLSLLFALVAFVSGKALESFRKTNQESIENLSAQLSNTIESNYTNFSKLMRLVSYNSAIQNFLLATNSSEQFSYYGEVTRNLSDITTMNNQIIDIILLDSNGQRYNLGDSIYPLPEMGLSDNLLHISNLQQKPGFGDSFSYLVLGKEIRSANRYQKTNEAIGNLYFIVKPTAFTGNEKTSEYKGTTELYLVDTENNLLWQNSQEYSPETLTNIFTHKIKPAFLSETILTEPAGYRIIASQQKAISLFSGLDWQSGYLIAIICILVFLVLIWTYWVRNLVRPMKKLGHFMEQLETEQLGGLNARVSLSGFAEAEMVGEKANHMLHQIHDLTEDLFQSNAKLYETELLSRQTELLHLRTQINPHFLYNTLETMVGIAYSEGQPEIAKIARSLGIIFKYSIKGSNLVPLKDEQKIVLNYIYIQHYRFSERFDVHYDVDEECMLDLVPKMVLQPLIENAIVHGIEQKETFCHLIIAAHHQDNRLVLTVKDDGVGIDAATLAEIRHKLQDNTRSLEKLNSNSHIGLINVAHRIKLMFGEEYGIRIESAPDEGTTLTLHLPIRKAEDLCTRQ